MAFEKRDNSGTMFHNVEKKSDRHPDLSGSIMIEGKEYFIDAWEKVAQSGRSFLSVSVKKKDMQTAQRQQPQSKQPEQRQPARQAPKQRQSSTGFDNMDDDIPF